MHKQGFLLSSSQGHEGNRCGQINFLPPACAAATGGIIEADKRAKDRRERGGEGRGGIIMLATSGSDQRHHSPSPSAGCVSTGVFIVLGKDGTGSLDGGSSLTLTTTGSVFVRPFNRFSQASVGNLVF